MPSTVSSPSTVRTAVPLAVGVFQLVRHSSPGDHTGSCHSRSLIATVFGAGAVAVGWLGREGSNVSR